MFTDFLTNVFKQNIDHDAVVWRDDVYTYGWLLDRFENWQERLRAEGVGRGAVTIVEADFSPNSIALFLALVEAGAIFVPLTSSVEQQKEEFIDIAQGETLISIDAGDDASFRSLPHAASHPIYADLRERGHPGLVLFSSGSTGKSKAAVHDLTGILEKFKVSRHSLRAITFLLYDHIGGVNTMLYTLSNGGCIVSVEKRTPDDVLSAVEKYQVELLPTSPTFLNLILISGAHERYRLDSLKTVTYGTEPMPESTLRRFHELFPHIRLQQTYGLSEVGILRSKSKSSDSLWVRVGGEGFETRIVDGVLQIKAESAMLGYLNAPSPFTEDGWFNTEDSVEVDGDFIRILGRSSEIINVGGEKVYPGEVESVIQELDNVGEVTVYGEKNPIMGAVVCATVTLIKAEDPKSFTTRLKTHCGRRLQRFKVPVKVSIVDEAQHSERFKKKRFRGDG